MSASTTPLTSTGPTSNPAFWERLWRTGGFHPIVLFVVAYVLFGNQPQIGASSDAIVAFYHGHRTRILIAAIAAAQATLYLMWFASAVRTTLVEAGKEGWASTVAASSGAVGTLLFLRIAIGASLAYTSGSTNAMLTVGLNDLSWACGVLESLPRAMLIMSCAFGLWRAALIPNALFAAAVTVVLMGVAASTTWVSGGFWSPDGAYARFVWPLAGLLWLAVFTSVLTRTHSTRSGW